MNWKEIKDEALQLMFAYSNYGELDTGDSNKDYLLAMPGAANYALTDISCTCRPILRSCVLYRHTTENLLGLPAGVVYCGDGSVAYSAGGVKSYTFRLSGPVRVTVTEGDAVLLDSVNNGTAAFTLYSGKGSGSGTTTIRVHGGAMYKLADLAFYDQPYEEIPPWSSYCEVDVREIARRSGGLPLRQLAVDNGIEYKGRDISHMCKIDGPRVAIPANITGEIIFNYYALPTPIDADTPDSHVPEIDGEAMPLVPLYIASRLYADDDIQQAIIYSNMYDAQKSALAALRASSSGDSWVSESGWI